MTATNMCSNFVVSGVVPLKRGRRNRVVWSDHEVLRRKIELENDVGLLGN